MPEVLRMSEVAGNPLLGAGKGFFGLGELMLSFTVTQCRSTSAAERQASARTREISYLAHISAKIWHLGEGFFLLICLHAKGCSLCCSGNTRRQRDSRARNTEVKCRTISALLSQPWAPFLPALPCSALPCPTLAHPFQISHPKLSFLWLTDVLSCLRVSADA